MPEVTNEQLIPAIEKLFNLNLDNCISFSLTMQKNKPPEIRIVTVPKVQEGRNDGLEIGVQFSVVPSGEHWTCMHGGVQQCLKFWNEDMGRY